MISVCLATYNGEPYIREQVASILEQLAHADELIISDDGSSDGTLEIIRSFNDPRIKLIPNELCKGVNGNFENAMRHAKGEYIFFADQDDVWLPGKVEHCVRALKDHACVVHDAYITDSELNVIHDSFFKEFHCRRGFIHNWVKNGYLGCAMAFRREILDIALPIPGNLPVWHDIWFGSIAQLKYDVAFIPYKGIKFRRHSSNTSTTSQSSFPLSKKISYRLGLLRHLFCRLYANR
ncbi:MAG: glycosyltransferase family 2 protein [Muribaculaceae bacterium]|nr:glycosyltransferase family 2 protein [Muribaculaceae bacterium]